MSKLWDILKAAKLKGHMVRVSMFPGVTGNISIAIYDSEKQMKQYLYMSEKGDFADIEKQVVKDWGHLIPKTDFQIHAEAHIAAGGTFPSIPGLPKFPTPPGLPKV